jgi:hypothetical protein
MRWKVCISALVIIVILAIGFLYARGTPHYSLFMLKQAIEEYNPDAALKYINIDMIVDNLGRNFLGKNEKDAGREALGASSLKGMVVDALPGIKDSIRSSIREAIASDGKNKIKKNPDNIALKKEGVGNNSKSKSHNVPQENASVQIHKNQFLSIGGITVGNLDVRNIGKISLWDLTIIIDGKTAIVSVKDTPNIKAKMAKTDTGYWQVVEILLLP